MLTKHRKMLYRSPDTPLFSIKTSRRMVNNPPCGISVISKLLRDRAHRSRWPCSRQCAPKHPAATFLRLLRDSRRASNSSKLALFGSRCASNATKKAPTLTAFDSEPICYIRYRKNACQKYAGGGIILA